MSLFVIKTNSKEKEQVIVSELCLTFHTINHHYRSMDCNNKLLKELFSDSKIVRGMHCGRTKLEAIATNLLSPLSIKAHLKKINKKCFSISSDASNKVNVKLFPICVQYFDTNGGIVNFVLEFYEDSNETSDAIFEKLKALKNIHWIQNHWLHILVTTHLLIMGNIPFSLIFRQLMTKLSKLIVIAIYCTIQPNMPLMSSILMSKT